MAPKIISYLYTGTNADGACCLGVLAAINQDGTAELWSREPNLGMVVQIVKTDTLEVACPIHALPHPETKEEYSSLLAEGSRRLARAFLKECWSSPEDIRAIARAANYYADLVEFADYGDNEALAPGGRQANGLHLGSCTDVPSEQRAANAERQGDALTEAVDCSASPQEVQP